MLTTTLIHPPLIEALARLGHGSKILIADGNYPFATAVGASTTTIWLNITPGLLSTDQALDLVRHTVPIEAGTTMQTPEAEPAPPHLQYQQTLGDIPLTYVERFDFYDLAQDGTLGVLIATGDQRARANLLLTVGMRS